MHISSSLADLIFPQEGKMRQISSQGRQKPPDFLAKAIGLAEPVKNKSRPGQSRLTGNNDG